MLAVALDRIVKAVPAITPAVTVTAFGTPSLMVAGAVAAGIVIIATATAEVIKKA